MIRYRSVLFALPLIIGAFALQRNGASQPATAGSEAEGEQRICRDDEGGEDICKHIRHCHDDENSDNPCVSFSRDVQAIFNNRCTRCHNPTLFRGMQDLTPDNSYANLVNVPTSPSCMSQVPGSFRVVPCDPLASMLWRKTLPDDSRCGAPMPLGSPGLGVIAPDEFALIEAWICQGARNN